MIYTPEEFQSIFLGELPEVYSEYIETDYAVNDAIDWRSKGAVGPVKDQGQCGSCYAFSCTGAAEGFNFLKTGKMLSYQESQLVDCSTTIGNQGCNGGYTTRTLQYLGDNGIVLESEYPYVPKQQACKKVGGPKVFTTATQKSGCTDLVNTITAQPTSVSVNANNWSFYSSGVFDNCVSSGTNHAVLAVGYDLAGNWIVKNSWGTLWGVNGYITLKQGNTCAVCSAPRFVA